MLDSKQKGEVMKMFSDGAAVSEIAKKTGVSRQSIYRIIRSDLEHDFENDAEIHALKKQLRKAELNSKIREVNKPMDTENDLSELKERVENKLSEMEERENEITEMKKLIHGLLLRVLALWYINPDWKGRPPLCLYCNKELKYVEQERGERIIGGYRCTGCKKNFLLF